MKNCIDIRGLSTAHMFRIPLECGKFLCFLHTILMKLLGIIINPYRYLVTKTTVVDQSMLFQSPCPQEPKWSHLGADLSINLAILNRRTGRQTTVLRRESRSRYIYLTPLKMARLA